MCGIVGVRVKRMENIGTVRRNAVALVSESRVRGLHAFGAAAITPYGGVVYLKGIGINAVANAPIWFERMIFHTRYATSGNHLNMENNQPIVRGNSAVAFNGVIHMGTQSEMEAAYKVRMGCENDAELALLFYATLPELVRDKSFAGVFLKGGKLVHYRNENRPAAIYEDDNAVYIASTKDIFLRAMGVWARDTIANQIWEY